MLETVLKRIVIIIVVAAICVFALFCVTGFPSCALVKTGKPSECVDDFFSALNSGDYEAADALLYNCSDLGFGKLTEGEYFELMQCLNANRQFKIIDEKKLSGKKAQLVIELTTIDIRLIDKYMVENIDSFMEQYQIYGGSLDDTEAIRSMLIDTMLSLMDNPEEFLSRTEYTVTLNYSDSRWKIVLTDELYSALIGYAI